ncbi:MAG: RPB7/RPC8 family DNA-directed RNA polymerase subunit, partial [Candidatus Nanoarchaeia archaeon]|nr:DNA-directed RNA polymerase [Candidatus Jingweiarchaeum tengchongense]
MYKILTIRDRIRVPPELFSKDIEEAVGESIKKSYEGVLDKTHGLFLAL